MITIPSSTGKNVKQWNSVKKSWQSSVVFSAPSHCPQCVHCRMWSHYCQENISSSNELAIYFLPTIFSLNLAINCHSYIGDLDMAEQQLYLWNGSHLPKSSLQRKLCPHSLPSWLSLSRSHPSCLIHMLKWVMCKLDAAESVSGWTCQTGVQPVQNQFGSPAWTPWLYGRWHNPTRDLHYVALVSPVKVHSHKEYQPHRYVHIP